jgi:uncharacterized protein (TIGR01244 family)
MNSRALFVISVLASFAWAACTDAEVQETPPAVESETPVAAIQPTQGIQPDPSELLRNGKMPFDGVLVGGQPTPDQFQTLAELGFGTVVNLRSPQEQGNTDPAQIASLGMEYVSLPITGADTLNEQNARKLAEVLNQSETPVVVHCASGNRVGGLLALKAFYVDGSTPEEALELGRAAGMTRTEPLVRQELGLE